MTTNPTFLVLDDDGDSRFLARHALEKAFPGSAVLEATSTDEAIQAAKNATFDGVITDHHLATRDGAAMIGKLRDLGVRCPVVMVTASSDPAVFRRAYAAGAARVFAGTDFDFVGYFRAVLDTE